LVHLLLALSFVGAKEKKSSQICITTEFLSWYLFGLFSEANMLYLESPAGVGFSYSTDPSFYGGVGDSMTGGTSMLAKLYLNFSL
jgi:hypothetical protein